MTRKAEKKLGKSFPKREAQAAIKTQSGFFSRIKFTESYTSLVLGAIVVLIIGILFISFTKLNRPTTQTSSVMDIKEIEDQILRSSNTSSTYTVRPGDDLWTISENTYNDGYKWIEIAKLNKIENPGQIEVGEKLSLPNIAQEKIATQNFNQNSQTQNPVIQNNLIAGNSYTVVSGDNLWDIAVRAYGDGFKWPEIAKANNLANPSIIHAGNFFKIPR